MAIVLGMENKKGVEHIRHLKDGEEDHVLLLAPTGYGKDRSFYLPTIFLTPKIDGRSLIIPDLKGDLYLSTKDYLESEGYEVRALDFRDENKSEGQNYMDEIVKALREDREDDAQILTQDLSQILMGERVSQSNENPVWEKNEKAVIDSSILAIAKYAPIDCKNLTNVYLFLSELGGYRQYIDFEGKIVSYFGATEFFNKLPLNDVVRNPYAPVENSPQEMRLTYFTCALATMNLFSLKKIQRITRKSTFNFRDLGNKKMALFIIYPDERSTYNRLVSMTINNIYSVLVDEANKNGGVLKNKIDMLLNEFGLLPCLPNIESVVAAARSRGIRLLFGIQSIAQLEKVYDEKMAEIIIDNCQTKIYFGSNHQKTKEMISKELGHYTTQVTSTTDNFKDGQFKRNFMSFSDSYQKSYSLAQKSLLDDYQIGFLDKPYGIVTKAKNYPLLTRFPDIAKYEANKIYGMGDRKHNQELFIKRAKERPNILDPKPVEIWNFLKCFRDENLFPLSVVPTYIQAGQFFNQKNENLDYKKAIISKREVNYQNYMDEKEKAKKEGKKTPSKKRDKQIDTDLLVKIINMLKDQNIA